MVNNRSVILISGYLTPEEDIKEGTYISLDVHDDSKRVFEEIISMVTQGIPIDDLHCTLVYDLAVSLEESSYRSDSSKVFTAKIKEFVIWDTNQGGKCLICLLESNELMVHQEMIMKYGYHSDFPDYKPHTTLLRDIPERWDRINELLKEFNTVYVGTEVVYVNETMEVLNQDPYE